MKKVIYIVLLLLVITMPLYSGIAGFVLQILFGGLLIILSLVLRLFLLITGAKHKGWFLRSLLVGGVLCLIGFLGTLLAYPTMSINRKIPPVKYENMTLKDILHDIGTTKAKLVNFSIYKEELANRRISIETKKPMSLKAMMDLITAEAKCQYRYGHCGTCGGLLGPIRLYENPDDYNDDNYRLYISYDGKIEEYNK